MTDLQEAYNALKGKLGDYNELFNYAEGKQPLLYSTTKLKEAFRLLTTHFQENWCAVVVDAADDRLSLSGWDAQNAGMNDALDSVWNDQHIFLDADEVHRDVLITGEGFIIAWKDGETLDVYRNDPRMCAMFYDPARPKVKRFAAKWWNDAEFWYITLYYPDHLEYYAAKAKSQPTSAGRFEPMTPDRAPNPFGVIPVFHYRGPGELGQIRTLQDAVNKLFADMMVAAEFGAFRQRYIIGSSDPISVLKNAPNENWYIPGSDGTGQPTSVGQFDVTPLENYLTPISDIANAIAIISRTPKHYFYNAGSSLSGEALLAMEAPLTKKCKKYQDRLGVTWQELGAFLLKLSGAGEVSPTEITPTWEPAQSVQPMTEAQTLQTNVNAGIPLVTSLKRAGWSESDIQVMEKDKQDEQKQNAAMAPLLLDMVNRQDAQSNNPPMMRGNNRNNEDENGTE